MEDNQLWKAEVRDREPDIRGRSKDLWLLPDGKCYVRIIPSLRSFTYERDELIDETGPIRLDFYERAAQVLEAAGVRCAFHRRVDSTSYLAAYHPAPPFEVIVKNRAVGSTTRKYPGLFEEGTVFPRPVVKFDYRCDPEDQPIGEDYLRLLGVPVEDFRRLAVQTNEALRRWLSPLDLWDFCLVIAQDEQGLPIVISEVSPDCMRLRDTDGQPLDKDLFRMGATAQSITDAWRRLLDGIG